MSCPQMQHLRAQETSTQADLRFLANRMARRVNGPTNAQLDKVDTLKHHLHVTRTAIDDHRSWCGQCNGIEITP